jgi:hypothetical protein
MADDTKKRMEDMLRITNPLETIKAFSTRPIIPEIPKLPDRITNPARWTYKRLAEYIQSFEEDLDDDLTTGHFFRRSAKKGGTSSEGYGRL